MKKIVRRFWWIIIIILTIPIVVNTLCLRTTIITVTENDWIGFWGSYLGAIVGGVITLYVLYKTNNITKKIQNENLKFELRKEVYFKIFENASEVTVDINNCKYIENYKFIKINHLAKISGQPVIDEELLKNYNNSLAEVIYELKNFVIDNYIKGTDEKSKVIRSNRNLDNFADEELQEYIKRQEYMEFQFTDEENSIAFETSRYILGAEDMQRFDKVQIIMNYLRRRAYGLCSDGTEFWLLDRLKLFINDKYKIEETIKLPEIDFLSIKEKYEIYKKSRKLLTNELNRIIEENIANS